MGKDRAAAGAVFAGLPATSKRSDGTVRAYSGRVSIRGLDQFRVANL